MKHTPICFTQHSEEILILAMYISYHLWNECAIQNVCSSYFHSEEMILCQQQKNYPPVPGDVRYSATANPFVTLAAPLSSILKTGRQKQKRIYESFTCDDPTTHGKRKAEALAAEFAERKNHAKRPENYTFNDALTKYIEEREAVLSPASIRKYRSMQRNCLRPLASYMLKDMNQDIIQGHINQAAFSMSPKSIRDMNGLIAAVLGRFYPDLHLRTTLPKKLRPNLYIPSDEDIKKLISSVEGTKMELPVLLAAFGALRRGEICALSKADFYGNTIHVSKTMVLDTESKWIIKAPKSYAGDRYVTVPIFVAKKFEQLDSDRIEVTPNEITNRFKTILKNSGLPHFRFHDLRHYNASVQHALGIPDAYIMQAGGWGNDQVLKEVYRHALPDVQQAMENKALKHFEKMQHEMQHGI